MKTTVLTKSNVFIIGPVATLLGFIINALYLFLSGAFNIQNIGLCIILFTIVINVLMLPLTIKQQKSSKLTQVMNPELQAIAKKYKNKKDRVCKIRYFSNGKLSANADSDADSVCNVSGYMESTCLCKECIQYVYRTGI